MRSAPPALIAFTQEMPKIPSLFIHQPLIFTSALGVEHLGTLVNYFCLVTLPLVNEKANTERGHLYVISIYSLMQGFRKGGPQNLVDTRVFWPAPGTLIMKSGCGVGQRSFKELSG